MQWNLAIILLDSCECINKPLFHVIRYLVQYNIYSLRYCLVSIDAIFAHLNSCKGNRRFDGKMIPAN